jgi:ArsR family transcriptional regulator
MKMYEYAMNDKSRKTFEARASVIKALAHPTRLIIVDELSRRERCVCELREIVGDDMSTVSKHLSVLRQAGIVQDEKRGLQVWYRLKVPCILNFFGCVEKVLDANARQAMAAAKSQPSGRRVTL